MNKKRFQNPWFWVGIGSVMLSSMGISADMFTSWEAVGAAVVGLFSNPLLLGTTALSVLAVFIDPTTPGMKDGEDK